MRLQSFPGGMYADAWPSGAYVVLMPHAQFLTHQGTVALPPGESYGLMFPVCSEVGGFHFGGQAHETTTPASYEWSAARGWEPKPPPCVGVWAAIYDHRGILHTSDGSIGSQGWRYVEDDGTPEGKLIPGDATLRDPISQLHEYTVLPSGLKIGQGQDGGVLVWDGIVRRLLHPGDCFAIRAHQVGSDVAIAFYAVVGGQPTAYRYSATVAELEALPVAERAPAPVLVPVPAPHPAPSPEPVPVSNPIPLPSSVLSILARFAATIPPPTDGPSPSDDAFENRCRAWCLLLAEQVRFETQDARWGVKNAGGGRPQSKDSLTFNGTPLTNYDLLSGVGTGHPTLVGHPTGEDITGQTFVSVSPVDHLGVAAPVSVPPVTPPADDNASGVLAILMDLNRRLTALETAAPAVPDLSTYALKGGGVTVTVFGQKLKGSIDK